MSYPDRSRIRALTFAEMRSSVVGPIGSKVYVTDVGEYGAEYISNGVSYNHSGEIEIIQKAKGWICPSLAAADAATYSQTGTLITVTSVGHNIPATSYDSKDVYLNMGVAATGATIPPGWFSNFTRIDVDTFTCVSTISQTGTGAVNTNLAYINVADLNGIIKGGSLGLNGVTKFSLLGSNNNSAGVKNIKFAYGSGLSFYSPNTTTTYISYVDKTFSNRNSNTSKVCTLFDGSITVFNVDSSIDQTCSFYMQCESANDYVAIHSASLYINPS